MGKDEASPVKLMVPEAEFANETARNFETSSSDDKLSGILAGQEIVLDGANFDDNDESELKTKRKRQRVINDTALKSQADRIESIAKAKYLRTGEDDTLDVRKLDVNLRKDRTYKHAGNTFLRRELIHTDQDIKNSILSAARAEILRPHIDQGGVEKDDDEDTYQITQKQLYEDHADMNTRAKVLDLKFDKGENLYGPYHVDYTNNGRYLAFGGYNTGHIAVMDCLRNAPMFEIFVKESVRDLCFLHSEKYLAVAQKKYLFIYDNTGMELHRLKNHEDIEHMDFLKYHFLLVTINKYGQLVYQDTSTGEVVAKIKTRKGSASAMRQNKANAIIGVGHRNGAVTLWSPNQKTPLVEMFCHQGGISDIAFDLEGRHMVTAGNNGYVSIYDVRKTFDRLHGYKLHRPALNVDVSQTGLLSLNCGNVVKVWKDAIQMYDKKNYMIHEMLGHQIVETKFRPFEDLLCVGYEKGVKTLLIPGSGLAKFDTYEANPFETTKQLREREVKQVLEKLQPDMIALNPSAIATLSKKATIIKEQDDEAVTDNSDIEDKPNSKMIKIGDDASEESDSDEENQEVEGEKSSKKKEKHRMKGRSKIGRKLKAKSQQQANAERAKYREQLQSISQQKATSQKSEATEPTSSLSRFKRKD